ncbi:hypothetical protein [Stutzerimonas frequens]|uniref:Uncharacterized protein n=1 Tax=Stutzerimonas frequens TaxID=2968969 RepID=A0AA47HWX2_9GAMM|nr:hypothetical protein [Stutzerimonas frequens]WAE51179.1 hypothetical protein OSV15_16040 [Stutzerimonas frequens]
MSDRELLELATKAAGVAGYWVEKRPEDGHPRYSCGIGKASQLTSLWNPLADDGQALRLAVDLQMTIEVCANDVAVSPRLGPLQVVGEVYVNHNGSKSAATRRAIVRAAAAIGRTLP